MEEKKEQSKTSKFPKHGRVAGFSQKEGVTRKLSSVTQALPRERQPLQTLRNAGILQDEGVEDEKFRQDVRALSRDYYKAHNLVPLCIDIYSNYPTQGAEIVCKDDELKEFYEELFFNQLNYHEFMIDLSREYWTVGEATTLGTFNEVLGVWEREEILNPDDIEVEQGAFDDEPRLKLAIPRHLRDTIDNADPKWEYDLLVRDYPEIVRAAQQDERIPVSPVLISRMINKMSPWDLYGTPHLLRGFQQLLMEESLNSAQEAVADRLYAPFILARLGMENIGDGGGAWIPDEEELDAVSDDINQALAADFKMLVHHFGLDIKSVFGRESMPRFDQDYARIERKLLQIWGIGESLISGSSNGAYASSALNRELVTQLMATHQNKLKAHFRRRAEVVAEAQEHFDYEIVAGRRRPIYEEVYEIDEKGNEYIRKQPKLLVPELQFKVLNLRDEAQERAFLRELKQMGVPVSDETMAMNLPVEFEEEVERTIDERVRKTVMESEYRDRARRTLTERGLEVPPELMPLPSPEEMLMMQAQQGGPTPEGEGQGTPQPEGPGEGSEPASGAAPAKPTGVDELSRNQIRQRPEISDEMRTSSLKPPRLRTFDADYKAVSGLRKHLSEESVEEAIEKRAWVGTRPGHKIRESGEEE